MNYLWLILLAIYILSPFDAHPLFMDDLIAMAVFFYMLYKNAKQKKQQQQYYSYFNSSDRSGTNLSGESQETLTVEGAYKMLGVSSGASIEDINKAYKEKMIKSHPDKVNHLSEELQEKAKEITLKLNEALELIKRHRGL